MDFLDQLRQTTPEVKTTTETPRRPPRPRPTTPPLSPTDPLPAYPFCIWSRVLSDEIWIVPDGWRDPVPGPAYTHSEIKALDRNRSDPEALRGIHAVKVGLDGEVVR